VSSHSRIEVPGESGRRLEPDGAEASGKVRSDITQ
jgi:hypothetical protein